MQPRNRKGKEKWRFATWNVGSTTGRVMCVQETKWRSNAARGYKIIYSGEWTKRNGVGIILSRKWEDNVVDVKRVSEREIKERKS